MIAAKHGTVSTTGLTISWGDENKFGHNSLHNQQYNFSLLFSNNGTITHLIDLNRVTYKEERINNIKCHGLKFALWTSYLESQY